MIVLVGTGQSNMESSNAGRGGDRSTEPGVWGWEQSPRAALGQTKGWKQAGPDDQHFPWNNEQQWPNGGALYARARHLRRTTGEKIYIVRFAIGGTPIKEFLPGGQWWDAQMDVMNDVYSTPEMASRKFAGQPLADEWHHHHGEANADYRGNGPEWLPGTENLIAQFRKKQPAFGNVLVCGPTTPVFLYELAIGGMGSGGPTDDRNVEIRLFEDSRDPYVINIPSQGLTTVEDGIHFDAVSLETMGGPRCVERAALIPKTCEYVDLGNDLVWIEGGYVKINAGTVVSIPLPVALKTSYVPSITLVASGTTATYMPKTINRKTTSFQISNPTAYNMIIGWTVTGKRF